MLDTNYVSPHKSAVPARSLRILVVEDDARDATFLQLQVEHASRSAVAVRSVSTLSEEITALTAPTASFDVVLLDLGFEGATAITGVAPDSPIVVLTGVDDNSLAVRAVAEGAFAEIARLASKIKVSRRAFGFAKRAKFGGEVEELAVAEDVDGVGRKLEQLVDELKRVEEKVTKPDSPARREGRSQ